MTFDNKFSFGAVLQDKDIRDYDLSKLATAVPTPAIFRPDYTKVPITYQGVQPACGSHSGATLEGVLSLIKGEDTIDNSPRFLWKEIKDIDNFPIEVGTDLYSILKTLKNVGVCDISLTGNNVSLSLLDYRNLETTPEMVENASNRQIGAYATKYNPTFQQIKDSIFINGAIIIQYRCGQNMYRPSWTTCLPLSPTAYSMDSGHFVVGIGFDENRIYFKNSWSEAWGEKGIGYFEDNYVPFVHAIGSAIDKEQLPNIFKHRFTKRISKGETNEEVVALQRVLVEFGYLVMPLGVKYGFYGELTTKAVWDFQLKNGVFPSNMGVSVGPMTMTALNMVQGL